MVPSQGKFQSTVENKHQSECICSPWQEARVWHPLRCGSTFKLLVWVSGLPLHFVRIVCFGGGYSLETSLVIPLTLSCEWWMNIVNLSLLLWIISWKILFNSIVNILVHKSAILRYNVHRDFPIFFSNLFCSDSWYTASLKFSSFPRQQDDCVFPLEGGGQPKPYQLLWLLLLFVTVVSDSQGPVD